MKLSEIEARAAKARFGPWGWWCNKSGQIHLATQRGGRVFVMTFSRLGMSSAQPCFQVDNCMVPATKIGPADHNGYVDLHAHPDAAFIAAAREDVPALCATVRALAEDNARLRKALTWAMREIRDNAEWPDTDDYEPTPIHPCEFSSRPDKGACDFCEGYWDSSEALAALPALPVEIDHE